MYDAWIGLVRDTPYSIFCDTACRRKDWYWLDGTFYNPSTFHDWYNREGLATSEPDDGTGCGRINRIDGWNDVESCNNNFGYICVKGKFYVQHTLCTSTITV